MSTRDDSGGWSRRILSWNVYVGQSSAAVRAALMLLAVLHWPHYIVLQEAKRFGGSIPGYRRHAADDLERDDADNCVILARKGLRVTGQPLPVDGPGWVHKKPKPSRVFMATTERRPRLTVVDVHRCTRGMSGTNAEEWQAEHATLVLHAEATAGPLLQVGDWNAQADRRHRTSPQALAERIGGRVVAAEEDDIDYAIVRGCRASIRRLRRKYGSDHAPALLTVTDA